jgi:hypothetical protein
MATFKVIPIEEETAAKVRARKADEWGNSALTPVVADKKPGYPCRLCLRDAEPGEELLLFSYSPFSSARPYRNVGPIFVHAKPCQPYADADIPVQLRSRLLSLRSFDEHDHMIEADVVDGRELERVAERMFGHRRAKQIHVHNAKPGCFACVLVRRDAHA